MEIVILLLVIGVAVFLSIVATWMVLKSVALSGAQKVSQIVLAWVIPFIGPIAVIVILTDPRDRERRTQARSSSESEGGGYLGGEGGHHGSHGHGHADAGHGGDGGGHGGDGGGGH